MEGLEMTHAYTRAQAVEDGYLIDVTGTARQAGFVYPVALTNRAWARYVEVPRGVEGQDEAGRLWDILYMGWLAAKKTAGPLLFFQLHVRNDNREGLPPLVTLKAVCGAGDDGEPVVTIMLTDED
jgi:hypothetical protein